MTRKIFNAILLAAGAVLLASLLIIMGCLYNYFQDVQEGQLKDELGLAAVAVESGGLAYLKELPASQYRMTWIAPDGTVLYDSKASGQLENHAGRAEIEQALSSGQGESVRYSATLLEKTMYAAKKLGDGTVLRISVSQATAGVLALGMFQPLLLVLLLALLLSGVLASRLSKRIVEPLNHLDLEHPLDNNVYDELSPLLHRIHAQRGQIAQQLRALRQKTDEFTQVTGNMQEGLVLLDQRGVVLSVNPAAQRLFGKPSCVGQDFLTVDHSLEINRAIKNAHANGHSQTRLARGGREYQLTVSRISSGTEAIGTVLLAFDVTEQEHAERNRREFTANVSHELKTPLQGIMGSAELIENGMVKKEDLPRFIGHIHAEAARLVALVEDIIRLSQLDEGGQMPREPVDLMRLAQEAAAGLSEAAAAKGVTVTVDGQPACVTGVRRLLYEVIYNLCDNAIRYNVQGGGVRVSVTPGAGECVLTVKDTGIGIAPEHQARVFERFYRVDKSHSKASGGTGLGLSIVKHAVQAHQGKIELYSQLGKGATVRVTLPA